MASFFTQLLHYYCKSAAVFTVGIFFFCYLSITLMYFVTVAEYIIGLFSFYSTIVKTGCWFVGGDDLTGALHDL